MNTGAVLFANNASSRLYAAVDAVSASVRVGAGEGARFPQPLGDGSNWFMVTLEDRRNGTVEICKCTGRSGDILNVTRAQEGTTAKAFEAGASVANRMTAGMMATFFQFNGYSMVEADARFINVAGDAMTGPLGLPGAPTLDNQAATKRYVDDVSIDEAPTDGRAYGRQSIGWIPISVGMAEPPVDGKIYGRKDLAWLESISKLTFDAEVTATNNDFAAFDVRVTANEDKNVQQDTRLGAIEGLNTTQDSRLTAVESKNTTQDGRLTSVEAADALKAPIASPTFTGDPKAPTPAASDNDTSIATTKFVKDQAYLTDAPSDGVTYGRKNGAWSLAGSAADSLVSVPADMSVGFKTGPNRLVFNTNTTLTGADVAMMDDFGRMSLTYAGVTAPAPPANSRSSITSYGDFTLVGAFTLGWNTYFDTVAASYKAIAAGWGAYVVANSSNGNIAITRSSASVAAGAVLTMQNLLFFDQAAGAATFLDKLSAKNAAIPATSRSALTMNGELTLPSSYGVGFNMYYDNTNFRAAITGWGGFININPATGALALSRSNASAAADAVLTPVGVLTFDPTVGVSFSDAKFQYGDGVTNVWHQNKAATIVYYKVAGSGSINWFKSGDGTQAGATPTSLMSLSDAGGLTTIGGVTTSGGVQSNNGFLVSRATGAGNAHVQYQNNAGAVIGYLYADIAGQNFYLQNNISGSPVNLTLASNGDVSISGRLNLANYVVSSTAVAILAATGAGNCYMRPNGVGSAAGQAICQSNGDLGAAGNVYANGVRCLTTADVLGGLGSSGLLKNNSATGGSPASVFAGSNFNYTNGNGALGATVPAGTWFCLGQCDNNSGTAVNRTTTWTRQA